MSRAVYFNWCPTCGAEPRQPCRARTSRRGAPPRSRERMGLKPRITDTHAARIRTQGSVHSPDTCAGEACVLHNPSDHHMRDWPMSRRFDHSPPMVERICPQHGVGHPDPDSAAWAQRAVAEDTERRWQAEESDGSFVWVHGCCGCCRTPDETPQPAG